MLTTNLFIICLESAQKNSENHFLIAKHSKNWLKPTSCTHAWIILRKFDLKIQQDNNVSQMTANDVTIRFYKWKPMHVHHPQPKIRQCPQCQNE